MKFILYPVIKQCFAKKCYSLHHFYSDNEIDGVSFIEITEEDVKGMIKLLGVVKKIMHLQRTIIEGTVSSRLMLCDLFV